MTFFKFKEGDILDVNFVAHPYYSVRLNGDQVTGSIFLEKSFLNDSLFNRKIYGYSEALGGYTTGSYPFSSSIDIIDAQYEATNKELYQSLTILADYYRLLNDNYRIEFTGALSTDLRVITIPEIYYDREVLTGSFSASDLDSAGDSRELFDDGRGGVYSGSLSGTLVGNIFYSEGLIVLTKGDLQDFGSASPTNFKWKIDFKGVQKIPTKIFKCRAPAGQLNATTNETYYHIPASGTNKNKKEILMDPPATYVTAIGLYNQNYELVGYVKIAQPVKKEFGQDILFRIRQDW